jgi:hypothetical protein
MCTVASVLSRRMRTTIAVLAIPAMLGCGHSSAKATGSSANNAVADASPGGPQFTCSTTPYAPVYSDSKYDYSKVSMDVDEWRDMPVRHRYVHGSFTGTDLRFAMYFPPKEQYGGRFFEYILDVSGNENIVEHPEAPTVSYTINFAVDSGGYLVESNLGSLTFLPVTSDPNITLFKASAAVAEESRIIATQMYCPHRPYGYIWGGSGGAFKVIAAVENTKGVWDGVVPFVLGTPYALPNNFTVQAHALRVLKDVLPTIVDEVEPGGSGNMYAGLNDEQTGALQEVTKIGFPPRSWFNYKKIAFGYTGVLASLLDTIIQLDPTYFNNDFWNLPGYLGKDDPASFDGERIINFQTTVAKSITADGMRAMGIPLSLSATQTENAALPAGFILNSLPTADLQGATITFNSGAASSHDVYAAGLFGNVISVGYGQGFQGLANVAPGDQVTLDNSSYLAVQTYHRHQTPPPDYYVYAQYRDKDGKPIYPQRTVPLGTLFNQAGTMSGKFDAKMIVVGNLMDEIALAWSSDWYTSRVKAAQGDKFNDIYRIWYLDHAQHTPPVVGPSDPHPVITTDVIDYGPVLQQALRDVAAWAERGVAPPASTDYTVVDGQVELPAPAADRKGVQPTISMTANGGVRADVKVGDNVAFDAVIDSPADAGSIVRAEWDFEGAGDFPMVGDLKDTKSNHVEVKAMHAFAAAGTYFPALRASLQRTGDPLTSYGRIPNLGRVRVVVSGP